MIKKGNMDNKTKHFLSITDLTAKEIWQVLSLAQKLKQEYKTKGENEKLLPDKQMVMLFEKPSLRTKLSFDLSFYQLGGHAVYFGKEEVGLGKREAVSDIGKVISSMADLIVARVFDHNTLVDLAKNSKVPVINALSNLEHPAQALADFLTILEIKGKLEGLNLVFVGDGLGNVSKSLSLGSKLLGINFKAASPKKYWTKQKDVFETEDIKEAAKDADIVVTDSWVGMGQEKETAQRLKDFKNYQVNSKLMQLAKKDAIFMHCLPAHKGLEVTEEVIDGPQSVVFHEAENRLHLQKALVLFLLAKLKVISHNFSPIQSKESILI